MACTNNTTKSNELVLLARNDADTAYEVVGGIKDFSYEGGAPVEDTTSSSTTGSFTTAETNGFKTFTMSASGISDNSTGTEPVSGLSIVGSQRLADLFFAAGACGKFQVQDTGTGGTITAEFTITAFSRNGSRPGIMNWSASFQNIDDVVRVGDI